MKKLALVLVLVSMFMLASCGKDDKTTTPGTGTDIGLTNTATNKSCTVAGGASCLTFIGSVYNQETINSSCTGGTVSANCSQDNNNGVCIVNPSSISEVRYRFYSMTLLQEQTSCTSLHGNYTAD